MTTTGPHRHRATAPRRRGRMVSVGRFFGVPVFFAPSWLLVVVLLTATYARTVRDAVPGVSTSTALATALAYAVLFAVCVLAHEMGHTAVALLLGKPVTRIVIFLLGGVSEIEREPDRPRDEFLIAAAGPLVSIVLAGLLGLGNLATDDHTVVGILFFLLMWSNLIVAVFNLLPGLPLDGGRLLRAGVWAAARSRLTGTRAGVWAGRALALVVAASGLLLDRTSLGLAAGLVTLLLAAYLWTGAGQALQAAEIVERLPLVDIAALLRPGLLIPADLSVAEALRRLWEGGARGLVLVDAAARPAAIVDERRVTAIPVERRAWTGVQAVARPLEDGLVLHSGPGGLQGEDVLAAMRAHPASEYLVVDQAGRPAGILATTDLARALGAGR